MPSVANFRRDLFGKLQQFGTYSPLGPIADKDFDTTKINTRFANIHNALRSCYNAIADIASRDSSFLPSFFQEFVNPIYVKTTKYPNVQLHKYVSGFNSNGTTRTFPADGYARIVYSYDDLGDIAGNSEYHALIFKNGELMDKNHYLVDNTAAGMQAFISTQYVVNNDEITLAVYRIYNDVYSMWKKTFASAASGLDEFVEVNLVFPNFYDPRYIKLAVRKSTEVHYDIINPEMYTITYNSASHRINIKISTSIAFETGSKLIAYDCTAFWSHTQNINGVTGQPLDSIPLSLPAPDGDGQVPVGIISHRDLDIWVDGRHLTPGKHFVVSPGYEVNDRNRLYINFLFNGVTGRGYRVDIIKNMPFIANESIYLVKDEIDAKGVEYVGDNKYPVFIGMGETYVNGMFIDNKNVDFISKNVLAINNLSDKRDFFYKLNFPVSSPITPILDDHMNKTSDLDRMIEVLGGTGELINRVKLNRPVIGTSVKPSILSYLGATQIELESIAVTDVVNYIWFASKGNPAANFIIDSNSTISAADWDVNLFGSDAAVDANAFIPVERVFDANAVITA